MRYIHVYFFGHYFKYPDLQDIKEPTVSSPGPSFGSSRVSRVGSNCLISLSSTVPLFSASPSDFIITSTTGYEEITPDGPLPGGPTGSTTTTTNNGDSQERLYQGLNDKLIPIYCSILAAVVVGLVAFIIFKRWEQRCLWVTHLHWVINIQYIYSNTVQPRPIRKKLTYILLYWFFYVLLKLTSEHCIVGYFLAEPPTKLHTSSVFILTKCRLTPLMI